MKWKIYIIHNCGYYAREDSDAKYLSACPKCGKEIRPGPWHIHGPFNHDLLTPSKPYWKRVIGREIRKPGIWPWNWFNCRLEIKKVMYDPENREV